MWFFDSAARWPLCCVNPEHPICAQTCLRGRLDLTWHPQVRAKQGTEPLTPCQALPHNWIHYRMQHPSWIVGIGPLPPSPKYLCFCSLACRCPVAGSGRRYTNLNSAFRFLLGFQHDSQALPVLINMFVGMSLIQLAQQGVIELS